MSNTVVRARSAALLVPILCLAAIAVTAAPAAARDGGAEISRARVLAPGSGFNGRDVSAVSVLQSRLLRLGYEPGPIDGLYGPLTAAAVRRLQAVNGVAVDGIAG